MKKVAIILLLVTVFTVLTSCQRQCSFCEGSGKCGTCGGDGIRGCYMIMRAIGGVGGPHNIKTCTVCDDDGQMICNGCRGTGDCDECR